MEDNMNIVNIVSLGIWAADERQALRDDAEDEHTAPV